MTTTRNIVIVGILLAALNGIFLFAGKFTSPSLARQESGIARTVPQEQDTQQLQVLSESEISWLSQYEGTLVRTTFVTAPQDLDQIFTTRLVKAEQNGIVLTFGNRRTVFFPYSNIISVEPR